MVNQGAAGESSFRHLAQSASHLRAGNVINSTLLRFQYPITDFGSRLFQGEDGCSPSANSDFLMVTQMVSSVCSALVQSCGLDSQDSNDWFCQGSSELLS